MPALRSDYTTSVSFIVQRLFNHVRKLSITDLVDGGANQANLDSYLDDIQQHMLFPRGPALTPKDARRLAECCSFMSRALVDGDIGCATDTDILDFLGRVGGSEVRDVMRGLLRAAADMEFSSRSQCRRAGMVVGYFGRVLDDEARPDLLRLYERLRGLEREHFDEWLANARDLTTDLEWTLGQVVVSTRDYAILGALVTECCHEHLRRHELWENVRQICREQLLDWAFRSQLDPEVREWVNAQLPAPSEIWHELVGRGDVQGLAQCLASPDERMQIQAALGLAQLGDPRAVETLTRALTHEYAAVRRSATKALVGFGRVEPLGELLGVGTEQERTDIAQTLVTGAGVASVPILLRAIEDPNRYDAAAWAIQVPLRDLKESGRVDAKALAAALHPAIQYFEDVVERAQISSSTNSSYDRRVARAVGVLGAMGDVTSLPALEGLLGRVNSRIGEEAVGREWINTGTIEGYISLKDDVRHIEGAIKSIMARGKTVTDS